MFASPDRRKLARKFLFGCLVLVLGIGGYLTFNWTSLKTGWVAAEVRDAANEDQRAAAASKLVAFGEVGTPRILELLQNDDAAVCTAVVTALRESWKEYPAGQPEFAQHCRAILAEFETFSAAGKDSVLEIAADALPCPDHDLSALVRMVLKAGMQSPTLEVVERAVKLSALPEAHLKSEIVPFLSDHRAEVRRAALHAIGPALGESVIGTEDLFPWLNDADLEVQAICEASLATRGMDGDQIAAARKLTHPVAKERLKLLMDLRWSREVFRDPGPWLERLSHDSDPAVRAGAARVACECQLTFASWLDRLAAEDPDGTVREIASYYRSRVADLKQTGFVEH